MQAGQPEQFLELFQRLSETSEYPIKLLVTSRKPGALGEELQKWPAINIESAASPVTKDDLSLAFDQLTKGCPIEDEADRMRKLLDGLHPMDGPRLLKILRLLQAHTGWPETLAGIDGSIHGSALSDKTRGHPGSGSEQAAYIKYRRRSAEVDLEMADLLLSRPLSRGELSAVLCQYYRQRAQAPTGCQSELSVRLAGEEAWSKPATWLSGIIDLNNDQVTLRPEIREIIENDREADGCVWDEGKLDADRIIGEFCFNYLASDGVQSLLGSLVAEYEAQTSPAEGPSPDVVARSCPTVKRLRFTLFNLPHRYFSSALVRTAATALSTRLTEPGGRLGMLWSKAILGNEQSVLSSQEIPTNPFPVLAELGLLSHQTIQRLERETQERCFVALSGRGTDATARRLLGELSLPVPVLLDALSAAMRAGDEILALEIADKVVESSEGLADGIARPENAVWAAVWLKMDKLLKTLLGSGASTELETGGLPISAMPGCRPRARPVGGHPPQSRRQCGI